MVKPYVGLTMRDASKQTKKAYVGLVRVPVLNLATRVCIRSVGGIKRITAIECKSTTRWVRSTVVVRRDGSKVTPCSTSALE